MRLFILRHGQAEPYVRDDFHRALTSVGRVEVNKRISENKDDLKMVTEIWASPYLRTQQTAEIACELLGQANANSTDFLTPEASPHELIDALYASAACSVLLVSHQPLVSRLIEFLRDDNTLKYQMNTASLACIDLEVVALGLGHLRWVKSQ